MSHENKWLLAFCSAVAVLGATVIEIRIGGGLASLALGVFGGALIRLAAQWPR